MISINQLILIIIPFISGIMGLFYFLLKEKLKAEIQYSTKINYDRLLEDYKSVQLKRQKAVLVAELLAEWISHPEDVKKLNQLTFEAFIWLPKETALKLSDLLSHKSNLITIREVLAEVRTILLGEEETINPDSIIAFPKQKIDIPLVNNIDAAS